MDVTASLIAIGKAGAGKVLDHLVPEARRLLEQRQAASGEGMQPSSPLAAELDAVIEVLTGRSEKPGFLHNWATRFRHTIVGADDLFRGDSLKAWLEVPGVRSALCVIAAARLTGEHPTQGEEQANSTLAAAYEHHLGDRGERARGAIDVIVGVLAAGINASLSADPAAVALAVRMQAGHATLGGKIDRLGSMLKSALIDGDPTYALAVLPGDEAPGAPGLPKPTVDVEAVSRAFGAASRVLLGWPQEIDGCWIERPELDGLYNLAMSENPGLAVLLGGPGEGKSALLARLGTRLADEGVLLLAIKADQMPRHVGTLEALDDWIGVKTSVAAALRELASARRVVLLVDQLDALADLMDVHGQRLTALLRLVHEVEGVPNLQVILTCREFEFRNDIRLESLQAEPVTLARLSWQQVLPLLKERGLEPAGWSEDVQDVLRTPQHLAIFVTHLAATTNVPTFASYQALLEEVVTSRIERRCGPRTLEAAERIAITMAQEEELCLGRARFDVEFKVELGNLEAEGFLVSSGNRLSLTFRHQTFFDFIRTRAFLRAGTSIAAYVIEEKQESLFVRPVLWSALQYLRASDPSLYRREFSILWSREALRPHLRSLLVAFLGQVTEPDVQEARWLMPTLDVPGDRFRTLRAMSRGRGWLARLRGRLPGLMVAPPQEAWATVSFLCKAVTVERDTVLEMVERLWLPNSQYTAHALEVVQSVQDWDEEAADLAIRLAKDLSAATAHFRQLATIIAQSRPDLAVEVVVSRLQAELAQATVASGPDQDDLAQDPDQDLLARSNDWYDLDKLVARAPKRFLEAAWPWLLDVLRASATDGGEQFQGTYRPARGLAWARSKGQLRGDLPAAFEGASRLLAETDPDAFMDFVELRQTSNLMVVHNLIATGMEQIATTHPQAVLGYLLGDPRRLTIGDYHDVVADGGRVIAALVPALTGDEVLRLERAIIGLLCSDVQSSDDPPQVRRLRRRRTRKLRLRLLRHFPTERLSQAGRRYREQEERAFPGTPDFDVGEVNVHYVASPMSAAQMAAVSDADILALFNVLADDTGWDHPRRRWIEGIGGSIPASREFADFAKAHPERALGIIKRFRPRCQERPAGAALAVLGAIKEVEAGLVLACVHQLEASGFAAPGYRAEAALCLREIARRANGLDDATCALLERWLADWVAPEAEPDGARSVLRGGPAQDHERKRSILWDRGGMEIRPGGNYPILDAMTLGYLLRTPPDVEGWLGVLERHLTRSEDPQVWMGLVHFFEYLRLAQHERAMAWLTRLIQHVPELLRSSAGVRLVFHVQDLIPSTLYASITQSWLTSGWTDGPQAVGEIAALRFCRRIEEVGSADELTSLLEGSGVTPALVHSVRLGAVYTLVEAWRESTLRAHVTPLLLRLVPDADEAISGALRTLFVKTDPLPADKWTDQILHALIAYPHVLGTGKGILILDRLKDFINGGGDPRLVCAVISVMIDHASSQLRDIRTSWAGQVGRVTEIVLTLHRIPETRLEGLALFERLIALEAYGVEERLANLDRRSLE